MGRRRRIVAAATGLLLVPVSAAPQATAGAPAFVQVTPTGSPLFATDADTDFWVNAVAPADVDADGDLDLAVLGFFVVYHESADDVLVVFRNDGPDGAGGWAFTEQQVPITLEAGASDLAWGDYDGDGDPDLAVGSEGDATLYRNDGGTLAATGIPLASYEEDSGYTGAYDLQSLTWADADNDDDLDLLVPSVFDRDASEYSTRLFRNDGPDGAGGWAFTDAGSGLDPTVHAQSSWADDDGDEDLDLFLANVDAHTDTGFVRRYENLGGGAFAAHDLLDLTVEYGLADRGDYDADGDLDILVAGLVGEGEEGEERYDTVLRTYRNDGGTYTPTTLIDGTDPGWLDVHAATWADYDSDGDVDLLVTGNRVGEDDIEGRSEVYANEGGVFTPLGVELPAPISSIGRGGAFTWFDLDNDRDLDYLVAGAYYVEGGDGLVEAQLNLYRNDAPSLNAAPSAPTSLSTASVDGGVELRWRGATDDSTGRRALTYDVEVRRRGSPTVTTRRLPAPGNVSATTAWRLEGLPPGEYLWTVRAVDSAFNGGPVGRGSFVVEPALAVAAAPVGSAVVPATGGTLRYTATVTNVSDAPVTFDLWTTTTSPGGATRVTSRATRTLDAGETLTRRYSQDVPADAPAGRYTQTVSVGDRPTAHASASFRWLKEAG